MKTKIVTLFLLTSLLGFVSCQEKEKIEEYSVSSVALNPSELTLKVGEKQQLTASWTPAEVKATPIFVSDNTQVATVDEKGEVTALAEGNAIVRASIGNVSATCAVKVVKEEQPTPTIKSELPLIRFVLLDGATKKVKDAEVLAYEEKMGRIDTPIAYGSTHFNGFVNKELATIPAVIYGLQDSGVPTIVAFSKEHVENCETTLTMLRENGFSNVKAISEGGERVLVATKDDNEEITLKGRASSHGAAFGAHMELWIKKEKKGVVDKKHDFIATARDFPSWNALASGSEKEIKEFENSLGFRSFNAIASSDGNLFFDTKPEKLGESNFELTFYVANPPEGETPWINSGVISIGSNEDLQSSEFKSWLALNGYDKNYQWNASKRTLYVESTDGVVGVVIFISPKDNVTFMQFAKATDWKSKSFRARVARETEAMRPLFHRNDR